MVCERSRFAQEPAGEVEGDPERPCRGRGRPRSQANVVRAALELIDEVGVKSVTMEAIAERAGISKVTLYRNWTSRAALLAEALLARIQHRLPLAADADPLEAILNHTTQFGGEISGATGELLRTMIAEFIGDPKMMHEFRDRYLGARRKLAIGLIKRGLKEGRFLAAGTAEALHDALYGAIFYRFLFQFGGLSRAEIRRIVETILEPTS